MSADDVTDGDIDVRGIRFFLLFIVLLVLIVHESSTTDGMRRTASIAALALVPAAWAGAPAFTRNYEPMGAWGSFGEEASPFFLNGVPTLSRVAACGLGCALSTSVAAGRTHAVRTVYPWGASGQ